MRRGIPLTVAAVTVSVLTVATLAACGSSDSSTTAGSTASATSGAGVGATGTTSASPSAGASADGGTTTGGGSSSGTKPPAGSMGGYATGVGSGPASSKCKLTAAQVGAELGEPVKATSESSSSDVLACYYRTTNSTDTNALTVTVEKVAVKGLYKQSRKANAESSGDTEKTGAIEQKCTVKDTTFDGHQAFTTQCTTNPDKQRVGGLQWDYSGGRFFHVSAQTVGRKDFTPAQLLAVSQKLAKALTA